MKISRLQHILTKVQDQFSDIEIGIEDGYFYICLDKTPTQTQIDSIPTAEYEEYKSVKTTMRILRIYGN